MARTGRCERCFAPLSINQDVCDFCGQHQDETFEYSKHSVILPRKEKNGTQIENKQNHMMPDAEESERSQKAQEEEMFTEEEIDRMFAELEKRLEKMEKKSLSQTEEKSSKMAKEEKTLQPPPRRENWRNKTEEEMSLDELITSMRSGK